MKPTTLIFIIFFSFVLIALFILHHIPSAIIAMISGMAMLGMYQYGNENLRNFMKKLF